ncbi:MAG: hypothetical protein K1000chlam2_01121 [Chlamydiae bacterium]|nr:hypothetical protein [Chlamydiota bacterium]
MKVINSSEPLLPNKEGIEYHEWIRNTEDICCNRFTDVCNKRFFTMWDPSNKHVYNRTCQVLELCGLQWLLDAQWVLLSVLKIPAILMQSVLGPRGLV